MPNDRLRDGLLKRGLTPATLAGKLGVDPKTVERWITKNRAPYPRHRHAIASLLRESESYLWPHARSTDRVTELSQSEIIHIYPRRSAVPNDLWQRLLDQATQQVGILVYAGLFLPEQNPHWVKSLVDKANAGTKVEILFGDPDGRHIAERGEEEGLGSAAVPSRIRNVLAFYRELRNVTIYFHDTPLYNSMYRFDDSMLVNTQVFGTPAAYSPVLHIRRISGGELFDNYIASFNRVIARSRIVKPNEW